MSREEQLCFFSWWCFRYEQGLKRALDPISVGEAEVDEEKMKQGEYHILQLDGCSKRGAEDSSRDDEELVAQQLSVGSVR